MRISDWSSDVCSSDLFAPKADQAFEVGPIAEAAYVSGQARGGRTKAAQQAHYPRKGRFALQQSASDEGVGERHEFLARAMSQGQPGGNPTRKFLDAGYRYLVAQLGGRKPCQPGQVAMVKVGQFVEEVASLLVVLGNGDSRGSKESVVRRLKVSDVAY